MRRGVAPVLLAVAALSLVVVGCDPTGQVSPTPTVAVDTQPSTPPPSSPSVTPTASPTPTIENDADAKRHAYDRMVAYYKMLDRLSQDPHINLDEWGKVAKGEPYETWRAVLAADRKEGVHQVGSGRVSRASVSAPQTVGGKKRILISVCVDYRDVKQVRADGTVVSAHGRNLPFDLVMQRYSDDWYVVDETSGTRSC